MSHDDFAREPIRGLPETPPPGEIILWQGAPNWFMLAREALNVTWVAGYFVGFAAWRAIVAGADLPFWEAVVAGTPSSFDTRAAGKSRGAKVVGHKGGRAPK